MPLSESEWLSQRFSLVDRYLHKSGTAPFQFIDSIHCLPVCLFAAGPIETDGLIATQILKGKECHFCKESLDQVTNTSDMRLCLCRWSRVMQVSLKSSER